MNFKLMFKPALNAACPGDVVQLFSDITVWCIGVNLGAVVKVGASSSSAH